KIELMNGLLFSLPGTPVLYYGDEIGMGDNIYLGDRNGVRTPLQWSSDRNAGFSRPNPQPLYLPAIIDPYFQYWALTVGAQARNPTPCRSGRTPSTGSRWRGARPRPSGPPPRCARRRSRRSPWRGSGRARWPCRHARPLRRRSWRTWSAGRSASTLETPASPN